MAMTKAMCIINRTNKLIGIQHEKKHDKGSKNSSSYFDNKMIEEEEMEKQVNDGTFDECAHVKDDDDLCAQASMMFNVRSVLHIMQFKKQQKQNTRKKELDS